MTVAAALATVVALGMWTGLARAALGAPIYAFALDAVTVAMLVVAAAGAVRRRRELHFHPLDALAAIFICVAVVEVFNPNVPSPLVGLEGFRKTAFTAAAYGIVRLTPGFDAERYVRIVAIGAVPALLWSIRQWIAPIGLEQTIIDSSGVSSTSFHSGTVLRAFAPTASPFHLGILAGSVAIVAAVSRVPMRAWGPIAVIAAVALGLSLTRANIIATTVALALVAGIDWLRRRMPQMVAAAAAIAALSLVVAYGAAGSRPPYNPSPPAPGGTPAPGASGGGGIVIPDPTKDQSLRFRFEFWEAQLNAVRDQPLIGYGTSAAADGFGRLYAGTDSRRFEPHSIYLKVLLEQGVIGFVVFVLLLAGLALLAFRAQGRGSPFDRVGLGIIVLVLVSGLTGPMLDAYPFNLLFWAVAGAVVNRAASRRSDPGTPATVDSIRR